MAQPSSESPIDAQDASRVSSEQPRGSGWRARLRLGFSVSGDRTVVRRAHQGPLVIQRPFYPEPNGTCHVYLIHPPGGVVGGDQVELDATLSSHSHAVLTTPGATKLYRSSGEEACVHQRFALAGGSTLEWLPQETIAFSGARARVSTSVELEANAKFVGWEILCLGRPASGERFTAGSIAPAFELRERGKPLLIERTVFEARGPAMPAPWGLDGQAVFATLVASGEDRQAVHALREELPSSAYFAVSQLRGALVARYLGPSTAEARSLFRRAWAVLRPRLLRTAPVEPRIWAT